MDKFQRVELAKKHNDYVENKYKNEIMESIQTTDMYDDCRFTPRMKAGFITIKVEDIDSVKAIMDGDGSRQCVLNFASYRHPGGGFLRGSMAQEEALCHESFLYNVLVSFQEKFYDRNEKDTNNALYRNRALYCKDIIFERNGKVAYSDVLTCACPNWNAAKDKKITPKQNEAALRNRIRYILYLLSSYSLERIILGAFGCGAFKQDPKMVAKIFHEEIMNIYKNKKIEIIFAIPKGNGNYETFKKEFDKKGDKK